MGGGAGFDEGGGLPGMAPVLTAKAFRQALVANDRKRAAEARVSEPAGGRPRPELIASPSVPSFCASFLFRSLFLPASLSGDAAC